MFHFYSHRFQRAIQLILTWALLTRSSKKQSNLGNVICQVLLSSNHALPVVPFVNDVAESLSWLLAEASYPLITSYTTIANLHRVCDFSRNNHIQLFETQFRSSFSPLLCNDAIAIPRHHLQNQLGA